jgi:hypothetical protein
MICYDCQPAQTPAVAVCTACGKAVCFEHCIRHERQVVERVSVGMTTQDRSQGRTVPRMLCGECGAGLGNAPCPQNRARR